MPPGLRKLVLAVHIAVSVGWIGAVAAYIALDLAATTGRDTATVRAAYLGMELIAGSVIAPLAVAALITGLVMSLGTKWGLFRHYWVLISFVLTILATVVLLVEIRMINALAAVAADPATPDDALFELGGTLVHSVGGMAVLFVILVLNVFKPRGVTPYGWRMQHKRRG